MCFSVTHPLGATTRLTTFIGDGFCLVLKFMTAECCRTCALTPDLLHTMLARTPLTVPCRSRPLFLTAVDCSAVWQCRPMCIHGAGGEQLGCPEFWFL